MQISIGLITNTSVLLNNAVLLLQNASFRIVAQNIFTTDDQFIRSKGCIDFEILIVDCNLGATTYQEHFRRISSLAKFKQFKIVLLSNSNSFELLAHSKLGNVIGFYNYTEGLEGLVTLLNNYQVEYADFLGKQQANSTATVNMFNYISEIDVHLYALSLREVEVLNQIVAGLSSREIGKKLGISASTVDIHRSKVLRKLGLKRSMQLILLFSKNGH